MFRFADPYYFLLILPLAAATGFVYRRRIRSAMLFSPLHRIGNARPGWRVYGSYFLPALFLAGLLLSIFALARPQTVFSRSRRTADVIAIAMVVDVSGSMEALDMSDTDPLTRRIVRERTRLDAVKDMFTEFVSLRPDDLIGLITFGGYASTRVPLTTDHDALQHVLKGVDIPKASQDRQGQIVNQEELLTAIGDALATACARLQEAETKSRIVVLLSDGESNTGIIKPEDAIQAAKELGFKVYTIGVGSSGRAPFRGRDLFGRDTIQYAQVALDEALLRRAANETGGRYFNVRDPKGLERALEEINTLEKTQVERDVYHQYNELFPWFLVPALVLLVAGTGMNVAVARRLL